jgi:hypothetical protein
MIELIVLARPGEAYKKDGIDFPKTEQTSFGYFKIGKRVSDHLLKFAAGYDPKDFDHFEALGNRLGLPHEVGALMNKPVTAIDDISGPFIGDFYMFTLKAEFYSLPDLEITTLSGEPEKVFHATEKIVDLYKQANWTVASGQTVYPKDFNPDAMMQLAQIRIGYNMTTDPHRNWKTTADLKEIYQSLSSNQG